MAFRANEEEEHGRERAFSYLVPNNLDAVHKERAIGQLNAIIEECGPVVHSYPSWHPLVSAHDACGDPVTIPSDKCGYVGLDHTIYFAHGFVTCPYHDGQRVIDSVNELPINNELSTDSIASITAKKLNVKFYASNANPVLVKCQWVSLIEKNGTIPKSLAVPLILEREIPCWRRAEVAESWERMRPDILGTPCGSRSSLFIDQNTGQAIKQIWKAIIGTGMFGPIR